MLSKHPTYLCDSDKATVGITLTSVARENSRHLPTFLYRFHPVITIF